MYNTRSYKSSWSNGANKSGGSRSGGYRGNRGGGRRRGGYKQTIDPSLYISTPTEVEVEQKYVPTKSFADLNLEDVLTRNITEMGYVNPTKIQDQAIPQILNNKDILGIGKTGSGKTGAFLIPMVNKVLKNSHERVLIVTPTRELASQISVELRKFSAHTNIRSVVVIGGASMYGQVKQKIRTRVCYCNTR